eukprot:TRINITY_DN49998_c0_g1_i1.p1 TRINITY_DN49998_c0_g1~~TRINITY_DN49998_c0_g1_i1.p1  ORF type:complete len:473 (+),score=94.10 TRINITY_DN49998_c0_g1_i1:116-1534(+)
MSSPASTVEMENSGSQGDSWLERELESMLDVDIKAISTSDLGSRTHSGVATTKSEGSFSTALGGAAAAAADVGEAAAPFVEMHDDGDGKDEAELFGSDFESEVEAEKGPSHARTSASAQAPSGGEASTPAAAAASTPPARRPVDSQWTPTPVPAASPPSPTPATDASFVDESRFTRDQEGNRLYKWRIEYAQRAGGGRAMCRDDRCLEKSEQAGVKTIEKGALRICRRVFMERDNSVLILWYHARCIFNTFGRAKKDTRVIQSTDDLEGFADIRYEDKEYIRNLIAGTEDIRGPRGGGGDAGGSGGPGLLSGVKRSMDRFEGPSIPKKMKLLEEMKLKKGDRVWTHCRVRPKTEGDGHIADVIRFEKSPKQELGMIVEEPVDGQVVIQFESGEHEKERIEKYGMKRNARIRAWLAFPRHFEGKKQRVPVSWINKRRTPPRLCSCIKQDWGHNCKCGISCGRGTVSKVFGLDL